MHQSVLARRIPNNCCRLIPPKCSNPSQCAKLCRIVTDWSNQSATIRPSAPNCHELLQIDPVEEQQSVAARLYVTNWFLQTTAIHRSAPNCGRLIPRKGSNPSQRSEFDRLVTRIYAAIRSRALNFDRLVRQVCSNPS